MVPTVQGTARIGTTEVTHPAQGSEPIMQAFSLHHDVPTKEVVIAVLEPYILTLGTIVPPGSILDVHQGAEMPVVIHANRHAGAKGPVNLTLDSPPQGITLKTSPTVIPADKTDATVTLVVSSHCPAATLQTVILAGAVNTGTETVTRQAPALSLKVSPAVKPK